MITGDHPVTAVAIGEHAGLFDGPIQTNIAEAVLPQKGNQETAVVVTGEELKVSSKIQTPHKSRLKCSRLFLMNKSQIYYRTMKLTFLHG